MYGGSCTVYAMPLEHTTETFYDPGVASTVHSYYGLGLTLIDCTTLGSARFDLAPKPLRRPWPITISQRAQKEEIMESAVENGHFQRNAWGFSKKRHLCRCKDHRTLTVGEKMSDRMDFLDANRLRVENSRNSCLLPWLRLKRGSTWWHKKPKTAKATKTTTDTQEVSLF